GELLQRQLMHCGRGVDQHGDLFHPWNGGLENLKVLCDETSQTSGVQSREPGHIAARMRQALDETKSDRVGHTEENHRDRWSSSMDRGRGIASRGDDNLWTKSDQLSKQRGNLFSPTLKVTVLNLKIPSYDIAA